MTLIGLSFSIESIMYLQGFQPLQDVGVLLAKSTFDHELGAVVRNRYYIGAGSIGITPTSRNYY